MFRIFDVPSKDHYKCDMTKEQVLAKISPKVDLVQWTKMVNYWFLDKTVVLLLYSSISF